MNMKHLLFCVAAIAFAALAGSCAGEDRSGEQPFAPTVETVSVTPHNIEGTDSAVATMEGLVTASPNSDLLACGFNYGNDTLSLSAEAELQVHFFAQTDTLAAGTYFAVAYAKNGIGTTYADTLWFTIE